MVSCSPALLKKPDFCFPSQEQLTKLEYPSKDDVKTGPSTPRKRKKDTMLDAPTFSVFPRLPVELRLKIWRATIEEGRVLEIQEGLHGKISNRSNIKPWLSLCPPPSLLHVNSESRKEGLRFYSLSFGKTNRNEQVHSPRIYFCPEKDIVYFGPRERQRAFSSPNSYHLVITERAWVDDFRRIRRVAMIPKGVFELVHWKADCLQHIEKALIIVENRGRQFRLGSTPKLIAYEDIEDNFEHQSAIETRTKALEYLRDRSATSECLSEACQMTISLVQFVKADGDEWADDGRPAAYCRLNGGLYDCTPYLPSSDDLLRLGTLDSASGALSTKWYQPHPNDRHS